MRLYFLRHGIAEDRRPDLPDARRRLTPEGIDEMKAVGRGMKALGLKFDAILTSPLLRARETAEIAADALGAREVLREEPLLASGAGFSDVIRSLEGTGGRAHVLLVGHEPDFSEAVSELIGGGAVRMKKAALACVDASALRPGAGELRWLLEPAQLSRIKG
jgi:phosphohistidine phosphatase